MDGLWQIENYTEGGRWLQPPPAERLQVEGVLSDSPMDLLLGVTEKAKIEELFGLADEVAQTEAGAVYTYKGRQMLRGAKDRRHPKGMNGGPSY